MGLVYSKNKKKQGLKKPTGRLKLLKTLAVTYVSRWNFFLGE